MGLHGKTCGVCTYGPRAEYRCCEHGCENCRVGCFNPAAYRNPWFGKNFLDDEFRYWWRCGHNHAEYLCVECYEQVASNAKETEERYRDWGGGYKEDPEFTKFLETL
jgi:hypothetical protein